MCIKSNCFMWQMKWFLISQLQPAETSATGELCKPISTLETSMLPKSQLHLSVTKLWKVEVVKNWPKLTMETITYTGGDGFGNSLILYFLFDFVNPKAKLFNWQICWDIILKIFSFSFIQFFVVEVDPCLVEKWNILTNDQCLVFDFFIFYRYILPKNSLEFHHAVKP